MLDVVILENTLSISMDLRTNSWDYIALLVGYKSTTEHVRDSEVGACLVQSFAGTEDMMD